ncbi:DDE-type integrase/transposase/recombinase [Telmatocola sphagniphila]|uniref:DDE-type integrase/transposase/recombinase n=1 Tax=Telmatocola sphagniphila TaxID=1123043 RepID=A0A8E6EW70_9BACT|nr:DDE-type integrase/transposase/recombinase [Telmatocola sphagniphila]QVL30263.1 DDE-type integrase/transposase/recombinase [Telmatocola sphagniphila]
MDEFNQNAFAEKREEQPRAGPTEDRDPQSAAAEVGRAEPSAPERSEGERRGARPTSESFPDAGLDLSDSVDSEVEASLSKRREFHSRLSVRGPVKGRRLVKKPTEPVPAMTAEQRILLLDTWQRSGLPAGDFAPLVGVSKHTLYAWKKRFEISGPAGLLDQPRGKPPGSRVHELTKRTILMLKKSNPEWGCQRISDMLLRGPALPASASAVARVLHEAGYQLEQAPTRGHPDKVRSFERARPNQLWQTDLFTFVLKRQNRRVHLVGFMDDHSRFLVGYGLHASQSSALVLEVLRASMASYGTPEEILTDNGTQYVTWRGKSAFSKELEKRGIRQVVASPRHPQTLGKIERFWGTLWRECIESAIFIDMGDAQRRIGLFIDHYNFQRPHQGIDGLVPADRYFGAASEVRRSLQTRVAANALELARNGIPKQPFYLTGQVGGQPFSVHAEGERMILTRPEGERREIDLVPPPPPESTSRDELPKPVCPVGEVSNPQSLGSEEPSLPGESPLDESLRLIEDMWSIPPEGGDL